MGLIKLIVAAVRRSGANTEVGRVVRRLLTVLLVKEWRWRETDGSGDP